MQEIIKLVPEIKGKLYLSSLFKVIESFFEGAPYGFLILTLNDLLAGSLTIGKVVFYTSGMASCFLVQGIFTYLFNRVAYPIGTKITERIRIIVGEHLRKLSMGYFSEKRTGDLNALIADELMMVTIIPTGVFPQLINGVTLPVVFSLFLFVIDWRLALVTLAVIPVSIPLFLIGQKKLRTGVKKRSSSLIDISSKIIEYVQGMEVVRAFKQTGQRFSRFDETLKKFKRDNLVMALEAAPPLLSFKAILDFGFTFILLAGAYLFLGGEITLFTFLIFLILGLRAYEPIKALTFGFEIVRITEVTINRIRQLLDTPPLPQPVDGPVPETFDIEFKDVTFGYDESPVLQKVSFTIPEKTITALVGPSGAGKTTITSLIARFWDVDAGEIRIGGHNIREMKTDVLLSLVSMVFQDVYLFNDTIYTNIAYGSKNTTKDQIIEAARTAQCHDFINKLPHGYDTMVGEGGSTLSGGEKQRISIARAILKDAPIILLDEATASVDPENEHLIQDAINALVKSKTLIIIAHRLSTITSADQIIVLNSRGSLEEVGKLDGPFETERHAINWDGEYYWEQEGNGENLRVKYEGDAFNLLSVTGRRDYEEKIATDIDMSPFPTMGSYTFKNENELLSQEVRIFSSNNHGPFEWLAGLYGFKEEVNIDILDFLGSDRITDIDINGYAVFGQGTYTFFDRFHLTAGLRYDYIDLEGDQTYEFINMMGNPQSIDFGKDFDNDEILPKFSIAYDVTDNIMTYVSVSRGYLAGGYHYSQATSEENFTYDPEYTWNYEIGTKTSWLNNKLMANLSAFYIDIKDKQVAEFDPILIVPEITNAAEAHSMGVELELQARPMQGLDFFAGFGYTEAKIDDWIATEMDMMTYQFVTYDYEDKYLPDAPEYTYNLGVQYRHLSGFFGRVDLLGTGSFYHDAKNRVKEDGYELVNLRLGYEREHFDIIFWCKNLFNEEYETVRFEWAGAGVGGMDGEPRMFGATVTYRF